MHQGFTKDEWDICIKVLKELARDPEKTIDVMALKGLVTKIYKRAKKDNKKAVVEQKVENLLAKTQNLSITKIQRINRRQGVLKQYDKLLLSKTVLHQREQNSVETHFEQDNNIELELPQRCYCCKKSYKKVHFFYHLLCEECAQLSFRKRNQHVDLSGRRALITGGRVKIGYLLALSMLRDGAEVWVTTRFPNDAAQRFSKEPDFENWNSRLKIVSLDLRNLNELNQFIQYFLQEVVYLDIIVNNAAQTIKRPAEFYAHLFDFEQQTAASLPENIKDCLVFNKPFQFLINPSEQKLLPFEAEKYFPKGQLDKDAQQIDLRNENSWSQLIQDVTPLEMLEVQLVNVTAPFILNGMLLPLFKQSPFERKFIVNVSAMEGQFNRSSKTPFHPHTNMAKAALNMMTRTSAQQYAQEGIYMNSVDTGWITQENPHQKKEQIKAEGFVTPLDETDGMARIYDPIVQGIQNPETPLFGHFLKDFKPFEW
jgi:NAD(P)-dependent dehydrogenase (short-subunit alcohol dehydrogenase family)